MTTLARLANAFKTEHIGPDQLASVARVTRNSMVAYLINVAIALAGIHHSSSILETAIWALLAMVTPSIVLARSLRTRSRSKDVNVSRGIRKAIVFAVLLGLPWGLLGAYFRTGMSFEAEILVFALVIGMGASGSILLAPVAPAALCYVAAVLVPLLLACMYAASYEAIMMALLVITYGAFLLTVIASSAIMSIQRSQTLRDLEKARSDVDQLNQTLEEKAIARTTHLARQQSVISSLMEEPEVRTGSTREGMQLIVATLARELGVDRCGYWLINSQNTGFAACQVYNAQTTSFEAPVGWNGTRRFDAMLRVSSKKIIAVDNTRIPNPLFELNSIAYQPLDIKSTIQAPILSHGEHIGFITCSTVGRTMPWTTDHKLFISGIANLAALVLERQERRNLEADALQRAKRLSSQQQIYNDLMRMEADGSELEEVMALVASAVRDELDIDRVSVRLLTQDSDDCGVTVALDHHKPTPHLNQPQVGDPSYPAALRSALLAGPVAIYDCRIDPLAASIYEDRLKPRDIQSTLHAPILIGRKLCGYVACSTVGRKRRWYPEDSALAVGAANFVALALERHRREQTESHLREANEVKGQFLRNMSHELRTPLNGIFGMTELLARTDLSERQRKLLETMTGSSKHMLSVVNDILDVSRATSGALAVDHHEFDLGVTIEETIELVAGEARKKGLNLSIKVSPDVMGMTKGDAGRLKQVLLNLLSNAVKFTSAGTVELRVTPAIASTTVTRVRFEISDTGTGIAAAVIQKLFQPFAQADTSICRRFGGIGLGLTISRHLVDLMGGKLSLDSTPGEGTIATFVLPLSIFGVSSAVGLNPPPADAPAESILIKERVAGPINKDTSNWAQRLGWNVLVAEDNPVNQAVIEEYLLNLDCKVTMVENGALAVEAVSTGSFDIVLMDCQMPEMDGLTATRKIREMEKQSGRSPIPIVAVTAHAYEEDRNDCIEAGMQGFVSKPCTQQALAMTMQQYGPSFARTADTSNVKAMVRQDDARTHAAPSAPVVRARSKAKRAKIASAG